jgi:hypothetical protein
MTLTVHLPGELAAALEAEAARRGQTPDQVATDLLAERLPAAPASDPVEAFIGSLRPPPAAPGSRAERAGRGAAGRHQHLAGCRRPALGPALRHAGRSQSAVRELTSTSMPSRMRSRPKTKAAPKSSGSSSKAPVASTADSSGNRSGSMSLASIRP